MKCVDCRFWNRNGNSIAIETHAQDPRDGDRRRCLRIRHVDGYEASGPDIAVLTDGSGYAAALWTDPEFGCTLFEATGATVDGAMGTR